MLYINPFCDSKIFVELISTYIYAFFYTDIEKSKKNEASKKDDNKTESKQNDKLLKELMSLRDENELLKKRIKKFANFSNTAS
ncbi:hypothetical protein YYG_03681 [Plasmodium vinckei petteri]|uniref:Uncharacterized protein n=1 Tax=Plasmodium vinckei petteri TaxID=138298 RepID=W7AH30_PLAVN|nr:hypothetical protein YYG_03681 [Plasmodium vinckei petteri]